MSLADSLLGNLQRQPLQSGVVSGSAERISDGRSRQDLSILLAMAFKLVGERGSAILQFTAPRAGEGTTTVTSQVATAAAQARWCKVVVVNSGSRHCKGALFEPVTDPAAMSRQLHLRNVGQAPTSFATAELGGTSDSAVSIEAVKRCYAWLRANFALVLVDCPPVLESAEAGTTASLADGTVLIVEDQKSSVAEIEEARDLLLQAGGNVVGVIVNRRWPIRLPSLRRIFVRA